MDVMRVATIHKPYFMPWMGFFSKLLHADVFIVQDNVLTSNRVWVNRSQIIRSDGLPRYITLPIGNSGGKRISDIELSFEVRQSSAQYISMAVEHAYARSRYFSSWQVLKPQFLEIMNRNCRLLDINMELITLLMMYIGVPMPDIQYASCLRPKGETTDTVVFNCSQTSCDALILGVGNSKWTTSDAKLLRQAGIKPLMHDFYGLHPEYYQTRRQRLGFYRGLSIVDCILNEGPSRTASLLNTVPCSQLSETSNP